MVSRFMDACYKNGYVVWFDWEHWESEALALETDTADCGTPTNPP
ncbi:MAG: DUF6508 domain-containing protein [bacterium]